MHFMASSHEKPIILVVIIYSDTYWTVEKKYNSEFVNLTSI